jgi:hypothetical protein
MMDLSVMDFVLFNIVSYIMGIATGLTICCHWKDTFMQRSRSTPDFRNFVAPVPINNTPCVGEPHYTSPVLASAPPPSNPIKLTIE